MEFLLSSKKAITEVASSPHDHSHRPSLREYRVHQISLGKTLLI
jgi:hypothetical protein